MKKKTVFILGAGFSFPALQFGQSQIISKLKQAKYSDNGKLFNFIKQVFGGEDSIPLEDVYTGLDRSILSQQHLKDYSPIQLVEIRNSLSDSITRLFEESTKNKDYILQFARKICSYRWQQYVEKKKAKSRSREYHEDRIAVLSLNWDVMLDRALGQEMHHNKKYYGRREDQKKKERLMYIDFCMFDFKWNEKSPVLPSL